MKQFTHSLGLLASLAWDDYRQRYHTGDSRVLRWSQLGLMVFLLCLSLTSSSIQHYLQNNLNQLLGADIVISQYQPLTFEQRQFLTENSDKLSQSLLLDITLTHNSQWQQVQLKLVDDQYPLKGELVLAKAPGANGTASLSGPVEGEIWVDARLYSKLGLDIGQELDVAGQNLVVSAILLHEPDRLLEGHSVAMRAMVKQASAPKSLLSSDRMQYRYLLATETHNIERLSAWAKSALPGARFLHAGSGHPLASFWQRTENFLGLSSILLFLMAAIAIDQAGRRQLDKQKHFIALCMSMGLVRYQGLMLAIIQWLLSFLLVMAPALVLAVIGQNLIIDQMQEQFPALSAHWQAAALIKTLAVLLLLLMLFQIPNWLALSNISVGQLLRQQVNHGSLALRYAFSLISLAGLAFIYSDNPLLTGLTLGAMLASLVLMLVVTWLVLTLGDRLMQNASRLLAFVFFMMKQRLVVKSVQVLGIGLCITLLLFTLMLMKDLGLMMERYVRDHDGNLIITQASSEQIGDIRGWADKTSSQIRQLKPYVRGQLVTVNDLALSDYLTNPSDSSATLASPVRMHLTEQVPSNNKLVSGSWWQSQTDNWQQVSVEQEVMTDLGLALGDRLGFMVAGQEQEFTISASHVFKSGGGSVTFWFQIPNQAEPQLAAKTFFMGSMELPENAWQELSKLWQKLPSLRLLPIKEMTENFDKTLAVVTRLVTVFSAMILLMAFLVIAASVQGHNADDRRKNGLLLSFGLSKQDCLRLSLYEWVFTALIAAIGAIVGTWLAGTLIYQSQFSMVYRPDFNWLLVSLVTSLGLISGFGLLVNRASLQTSVRSLLQEQ